MEEEKIIEFMVKLYCKKNHKQELCSKCQELLDYSKQRTEKCPRKSEKTFCASCPIHCYKPEMREQIKMVMKFSGPRMIIYNPKMAISHIKDTIKNRKKK